jgi:hypothetical protein
VKSSKRGEKLRELERNEHYIPKREPFDYGVVCEKKGLWVLNRIGLFSKFQSIDTKRQKNTAYCT